jgi:hypothetical protein
MFMKKMFLVLIAVGSTMTGTAQIQFGVKAGYNYSNIAFSTSVSDASWKSGFSAGILTSIPLFKSCFFQAEMMYSGQGTRFPDTYVPEKLNFNYLNVPVLFKFQHSSGLFAETGPQFGFILSAKQYLGSQTSDIKNQIQSTDFAWVFGIGYKLPMGLGIDARYNPGLTNISKSVAFSDVTAKNEVFQFGLFYLFPQL